MAPSVLRSVLAGQTVQRTRALIPTVHNGKLTDAWFDLVYAPIPDADGTFAGLTCAWNERTSEVTGSRRVGGLDVDALLVAHAGRAGGLPGRR
jgi:hypothetical protein